MHGHSERSLYVRLAIERARVSVHAPAVLPGFDRAAAVAINMPPWRSPAGHLLDALADHCAVDAPDPVADAALLVLTGTGGEDARGRAAHHLAVDAIHDQQVTP